jgi:hypothetical protein
MGAEDAAQCVLRELDDPNVNLREVGYSAALMRFFHQDGQPRAWIQTGDPDDKSDVFVVTGVARGITPLFLRELAKLTGGGTFLLMGRSPLKPKTSGRAKSPTLPPRRSLRATRGTSTPPSSGVRHISLLPWFGIRRTLFRLVLHFGMFGSSLGRPLCNLNLKWKIVVRRTANPAQPSS